MQKRPPSNSKNDSSEALSAVMADLPGFDLLFDQSPQAMWLLDAASLRILVANDAAASFYGYSKEELQSKTLWDIRPPEHIKRLSQYCDNARKETVHAPQGNTDVWTHIKKDGTLINVEVTWKILLSGGHEYVLSILRDATEQTQDRARASVQSNALEQVTEAVFAVNNSREITYWNQAAAQLYGYSTEEVMGRTVDDVTRFRYLSPKQENESRNALREKGHWRGEKIQIAKGGREIYVDSSVTTLTNESGAVVGMLSVARDITEKKRVHRELVESKERLEALVHSSPVAIATHDRNGRVTMWNSAAERLFGWKKPDIIGKAYTAIIPESEHPYFEKLRNRVLNGDSFAGIELKRRHADGSMIQVMSSTAPIYSENGEVIEIVALHTDISAQNEFLEELKKAKEEADAANIAKTEFVANISHELRTPLGAILGFAEMMFDAKQSASEKLHCISRIRQNVNNLTFLIDDLLDLSKVEAGKFNLHVRPFSLVNLLVEVRASMNAQSFRKGLNLKFVITDSIPKEITSDSARLRQILVNVIGNAIKFTRRGSVNVETSMNTSTNNGKLRFRVTDTGIGIPSKYQTLIFEPFAQLDGSTTREHGGAGLGLNLSRRLARMLGGDLFLEKSGENKGSTFILEIDPGSCHDSEQVSSLNDEELEDRAKNHNRYVPNSTLLGKKLLVVEDGEDNRVLINHFLKCSGADVTSASDGEQGVEKATQESFDAILMDIQMPVMDGYEATRTLRENGIETPIIALTAYAMADERDKCFAVGCDEYLSKPVTSEALIGKIASVLSL